MNKRKASGGMRKVRARIFKKIRAAEQRKEQLRNMRRKDRVTKAVDSTRRLKDLPLSQRLLVVERASLRYEVAIITAKSSRKIKSDASTLIASRLERIAEISRQLHSSSNF
jgi:hypothetical protein